VEYAADSQRLNKTVAGGSDENIHVFDSPEKNFRHKTRAELPRNFALETPVFAALQRRPI
jgi:hypothetical protein